MKTANYLLTLFFIFAVISCSDSISETVTYKINEPVFMSAGEFRNSVKVTKEVQPITNYGKMCFFQGYLYISESGKGIHIIDNRNPSLPQNIGFIELMGNADISIRDSVLYADSYVDLVWFDVKNPANPVLNGRLPNVFQTALPPIENEYGFDYAKCYPVTGQDSVVIGWNLVEKTENISGYTGGWYWNWEKTTMLDDVSLNAGSSNGLNGSMSRFALYENKLYAVLNNNLTVFDLSKKTPEKVAENLYIGWNVETIFSYKDNLFMGTPTGMVIYSVTDPLKPVFKSRITHAIGCDPVVVNNDLAYITVHSSDACGQNTNELFIVDVKDVSKPVQLVSYSSLTSPRGLGIENGMLFLCDNGLKIFNLATPQTIMANQLVHFTGMTGFDVIPFDSVLMMIAEDGLYQYDYSNISNIHQISKIPFVISK